MVPMRKNFKINPDIIFVLVFIIFLFIPMMNIDTKTAFSKQQDKFLAKFEPLISKDNGINNNFGKDFDNWFNDRYSLKNFFSTIYFNIKYNLPFSCYTHNSYVLNKKTKYITNTKYFNKHHYYNKEEAVTNLKKLERFCDENHLKAYIILFPDKNEVGNNLQYPILSIEYTAFQIPKDIDELQKDTKIPIIFPIKILAENNNNKEPIYFKTDYHWTDIGANLAYQNIMNVIKNDFKNVKIYKPDDFKTTKNIMVRVSPTRGFFEGDSYKAMHLNDKTILNQTYTYLTPKTNSTIDEKHIQHNMEPYAENIYRNNSNKYAPNVYMIGESASLNIIPSLVSSFYNLKSVFVWWNDDIGKYMNIYRYKEDILKNKTDILLICIMGMDRLSLLFKDY